MLLYHPSPLGKISVHGIRTAVIARRRDDVDTVAQMPCEKQMEILDGVDEPGSPGRAIKCAMKFPIQIAPSSFELANTTVRNTTTANTDKKLHFQAISDAP